MELDPKIKSLSDILTCFDIEEAKQFIGQKGYFTDDLSLYYCLEKRQYGVLNQVLDEEFDRPFQLDTGLWGFFIPESRLRSAEEKPKVKKYRPYTFEEFLEKFTIGRPISYRRKDEVGSEQLLILNGFSKAVYPNRISHFIYIGSTPHTLEELFREYEWQEHCNKDFQPFGVEE